MYEAYRDAGVQVWAIASNESPREVEEFVERLDIDMPVLLDITGDVAAQYAAAGKFETAPYPQEWLVGRDGTIVYYDNELDIDRLLEAIESEL